MRSLRQWFQKRANRDFIGLLCIVIAPLIGGLWAVATDSDGCRAPAPKSAHGTVTATGSDNRPSPIDTGNDDKKSGNRNDSGSLKRK